MADRTPPRPTYDATIDWLIGELQPVRRLPALGAALSAWVVVMVGVLAVAVSAPRPDLATRAGQLGYLAELVGLAAGTVLLGALALRSAAPDRTPRPWEHALAAMLAVLAIAAVATHATATSVSLVEFVASGKGCTWATLEFAILPVAVLLVAVQRGAPVRPRVSGTFATGAGLVLAYLAMRVHCPSDDGAHLLVWHTLPVVIGTLVGTGLGGRWLGRWSQRP
ncbi:MAG: NrsF family protein [Candidatus Binatia bacterium]